MDDASLFEDLLLAKAAEAEEIRQRLLLAQKSPKEARLNLAGQRALARELAQLEAFISGVPLPPAPTPTSVEEAFSPEVRERIMTSVKRRNQEIAAGGGRGSATNQVYSDVKRGLIAPPGDHRE